MSAPSQLAAEQDPLLAQYAPHIDARYAYFQKRLAEFDEHEGGLEAFSRSYESYGFNEQADGSIVFREWCSAALAVHLIGEFNQWNRESHPCTRNEFGVWSVVLPPVDGQPAIAHGSRVKLAIKAPSGEWVDRLPAWITRAVRPEGVNTYEAVYWRKSKHEWKHPRPAQPKGPKIYEAHIGISSSQPTIASYKHFETDVLPRIASLGYNVIQLMAIMEHAYYASFGYQVTNFFAISSRFGTPEDLKSLIDAAHSYRISVLLDVVHSHSSKNVADGLNQFDGTDSCYFHAGGRGVHEQWDSRLFNYGSWEVLRFLLSNLRWYLEEYKFDGFRFDGVTSMLYLHHGMGRVFMSYSDYFDESVDVDACVYMMLANEMLQRVLPSGLSIAEDVSGMPLLCRPCTEGGFGFHYRLAMAIPDMWIRILKEKKDEDWDMGNIVFTLTNRRYKEAVIAYAESHDQALVGDKTISFWLMDKEMYTHMSKLSELTPVVDRGLSLHKLIRLVTHGLGGEGYLNFIGNEFGHPEWLDFPRVGNGESFMHARRQFNLVDDSLLRYQLLNDFDRAMNQLDACYNWLGSGYAYVSCKHEDDKVIVFERAGLVFAFNFHATKSFADYPIGAPQCCRYVLGLSSDDTQFGGHERVAHNSDYFATPTPWHDRPNRLKVYLPTRCAIVLVPETLL